MPPAAEAGGLRPPHNCSRRPSNSQTMFVQSCNRTMYGVGCGRGFRGPQVGTVDDVCACNLGYYPGEVWGRGGVRRLPLLIKEAICWIVVRLQ